MKLINADCLEAMRDIPDNSVDLILCDLPYGTTQNKWDRNIPLEPLWEQYKRICNKMIVLTAAQPFTSLLITSNLKQFKYNWVWKKSRPTGFLNAKKRPLVDYEDVVVFSNGETVYNPQGLVEYGKTVYRTATSNYGTHGKCSYQAYTNYPKAVIDFNSLAGSVHPTQKPVALMEYLIKTYTNEGDIVLDNCMGSGTTGVACANTGREFIGIEKDTEYFKIAQERLGMRDSDTQ